MLNEEEEAQAQGGLDLLADAALHAANLSREIAGVEMEIETLDFERTLGHVSGTSRMVPQARPRQHRREMAPSQEPPRKGRRPTPAPMRRSFPSARGSGVIHPEPSLPGKVQDLSVDMLKQALKESVAEQLGATN
jgi:hypothetical protein